MNVHVISIDPSREVLLGFLFPTYTITDSPSLTSKFITHRTVCSIAERDALDLRYDDAIFISNKIFDEVWDDEVLKQKVVEFSRAHFKNRKTKIEPSTEFFVEDCVDFMFGITSDSQESSVNELFEAFGSQIFVKKFLELSSNVPVPVLVSALVTFVYKILYSETSIFYKKKALLFKDKILSNLEKASDSYNSRPDDNYGLSAVKFFVDLYA